jgi:hypothetical protein
MTRTIGALALALGMLASAPEGVAVGDGRGGTQTFEGSCHFSGELRQRPPLTNAPQPGAGFAKAKGTCSGTLTDEDGDVRPLDLARAKYVASARGTLSCAGGTAAGDGFIKVGGERLRFRFTEVRGPGAGAIRLDGAGGGSATGIAAVSADEDPVAIAQKCSGDGLRRVRTDIDIATTPSMAG